jgi:1-acyl-sn-glycerol-3-phosphate acyltransferase
MSGNDIDNPELTARKTLRRRCIRVRSCWCIPAATMTRIGADAESEPHRLRRCTGYARIVIETGVPIVPVVSIGGQETQLFLTRGDRLAK